MILSRQNKRHGSKAKKKDGDSFKMSQVARAPVNASKDGVHEDGLVLVIFSSSCSLMLFMFMY